MDLKDDYISKSEFYAFGILPGVCIHSPIEDQYSKMYKPRDKCDCGHDKWIDSTMDIVKPSLGFSFPKKDIHRCEKCREIRMADHIGLLNQNE